MSLIRALGLAGALGRWADDGDGSITEPEIIRWATVTAGNLVVELMRLEDAAKAQQPWLPDRPFARTSGSCLHARGCGYLTGTASFRPLTEGQAEAFLRESREHRRCKACRPGISEPVWVQVRPANGRVRWRLADDVSPPGEVL